jgi:hypothetical protein
MEKRRSLFQVESCNAEDREKVDVRDVCYTFRGVRWGQSPVSGDWNNCHICGKWNNKLCVATRAVHLQRLSVN